MIFIFKVLFLFFCLLQRSLGYWKWERYLCVLLKLHIFWLIKFLLLDWRAERKWKRPGLSGFRGRERARQAEKQERKGISLQRHKWLKMAEAMQGCNGWFPIAERSLFTSWCQFQFHSHLSTQCTSLSLSVRTYTHTHTHTHQLQYKIPERVTVLQFRQWKKIPIYMHSIWDTFRDTVVQRL